MSVFSRILVIQERPSHLPALVGAVLVLLANLPLFDPSMAVRWDAFDEMWPYLRWMGNAWRNGAFGEVNPHFGSNLAVAGNLNSGFYNPIYGLFALLFPNSTLSINLLYLTLQLGIFFVSFSFFTTLAGSRWLSMVVALGVVSSGYVIGHASHLSYLATSFGLLLLLVAIFEAGQGTRRRTFLFSVLGTFVVFTAGYPANIAFGAQVLTLVWLYRIWRVPEARTNLIFIPAPVILGLILALPALMHFFLQLANSPRVEGISTAQLLQGDLPAYSLRNFGNPFMILRRSEATMERFHLSAICFLGTLLAIAWLCIPRFVQGSRTRSKVLLPLIGGMICTQLALGDNLGIPIRSWLADTIPLYRLGRFPSGEHRGVALFLFGVASLYGLQWATKRRPRVLSIILVVASTEFLFNMYRQSDLRFFKAEPLIEQSRDPFKIWYSRKDQALIDSPRQCPKSGDQPWVTQRRIRPGEFYWGAYTALFPAGYLENRETYRALLCSSGRLKTSNEGIPVPYKLLRYGPGVIDFSFEWNGAPDQLLAWADVNDGLWTIGINGAHHTLIEHDASVMQFKPFKGMNKVCLRYQGPVSRFWR